MSRFYDDNFLDVPIDKLLNEDYFSDWGIRYSRIMGYPGYFITDQGNVISLMNERPIILKTWKNQHGHEYVQLLDKWNTRKKVLVHRLVAEAFIPNPNNYTIVRHLDDDPSNNSLDNLAWGTYKDNRADCVRNDHDYRKAIYCFETDRIYRTGADAARELGINKSQVTMCCKGRSSHANGFHLCFEEDIEERMSDKRWMRNRSYKPIIAYGPNGEVLYFESRKDAAREIGIPDCGISSVVNGHLEHTHGWRFKEGE